MEGASEGWWSPGDEVPSAPGPSTPLPGAQAASLRSNPSWGLSSGASSSDSLSDAITFHSALEQVRSDTRWHMPLMMAACRAQGRVRTAVQKIPIWKHRLKVGYQSGASAICRLAQIGLRTGWEGRVTSRALRRGPGPTSSTSELQRPPFTGAAVAVVNLLSITSCLFAYRTSLSIAHKPQTPERSPAAPAVRRAAPTHPLTHTPAHTKNHHHPNHTPHHAHTRAQLAPSPASNSGLRPWSVQAPLRPAPARAVPAGLAHQARERAPGVPPLGRTVR